MNASDFFDDQRRIMNILLRENDNFALSAQLMKKIYDTLIDTGFTEEQALKIVANQGLKLFMIPGVPED